MEYKDAFMSQIRTRNSHQSEAHESLYNAYEKARKNSRVPLGSQMQVAEEIMKEIDISKSLKVSTEKNLFLDATIKRIENELKVKTRQIEGQQALLTDLQNQLSSKEGQLSELSIKYANAQKENKVLATDLERSAQAMLEKSSEVVRLQSEIASLKNPASPVVTINKPEQPQMPSRRAIAPKKPFRTLGLSVSSASPPCRLSGHLGSQGPRIIAIGSKKIQCVDRVSAAVVFDYSLTNNAVALGVGISPDGAMLIGGTTEGHLLLFDINNYKLQADLSCPGKIRNCGFLGERNKLFSASADRAIRIWDLQKGGVVTRTIPVSSQIFDAAVSEDGALIATAHQNGKVILWSKDSDTKIAEFDCHADSCVGVTFSRCGKYVGSVGRDDKLAVVDIASFQIERLSSNGFAAFQDCSFPCFSPDSKIISACSASDGNVYSFDIDKKKATISNAGDAVCLFWGATNHSSGGEGYELLTGHRNGSLKWWDGTGEQK